MAPPRSVSQTTSSPVVTGMLLSGTTRRFGIVTSRIPSENEATIARRLEVARQEWPFGKQYTYEIINHSIDQAVDEICEKLELIGGPQP